MNRIHRALLVWALAVPVALAASTVMAQPIPAFTNPTNITNRYYPVSNTKQAITLGVDEADEFRSEVTLLPTTLAITWAGGTTQTRVSQYVAYKAGDLVEVAYDYFAQADNGDLYYFGEDVFNYAGGVVANTNGTWRAGRNGAPPGLIMPARPAVGQVFHPENFRPVVFEEDTVVSLTQPTSTPLGPIANGLLVHELLLDGTEELKTYAAGFGQVEHSEANASSHLAFLLRNDASIGQVPGNLDVIDTLAEGVLDTLPNWTRVRNRAIQITRRWNAYQSQAVAAGAPPEFVTAMGRLVGQLSAAANNRNAVAAGEAAYDMRTVAVDLMNVHNPRVPADVKRLQVLERELIGAVRAGDWTEATIFHAKAADAVWGRVRPFLLARTGGPELAAELDAFFADQLAAIAGHRAVNALEAAREVLDAAEEMEARF